MIFLSFTRGKTSSADLSFHGFFSHALWHSLKFPLSPSSEGRVWPRCVIPLPPPKPSGYITDWSWMVAELEILSADRDWERESERTGALRSYFCVYVCACGSVCHVWSFKGQRSELVAAHTLSHSYFISLSAAATVSSSDGELLNREPDIVTAKAGANRLLFV